MRGRQGAVVEVGRLGIYIFSVLEGVRIKIEKQGAVSVGTETGEKGTIPPHGEVGQSAASRSRRATIVS